jgi:hypothetical protein
MQNHRLILYTIGFCASFASACKKKNNTEGSSCKIINIQDNLNNSTITIATSHSGTTTSSNGTIYPFEKFTYTFDEGNKITQLVTTFGAAVETTDYKYDCND